MLSIFCPKCCLKAKPKTSNGPNFFYKKRQHFPLFMPVCVPFLSGPKKFLHNNGQHFLVRVPRATSGEGGGAGGGQIQVVHLIRRGSPKPPLLSDVAQATSDKKAGRPAQLSDAPWHASGNFALRQTFLSGVARAMSDKKGGFRDPLLIRRTARSKSCVRVARGDVG